MNRFDLHPISLAHTHLNMDLKSAHRLIVLVPDDADYSTATRRIWEIAHAADMLVLLLALCRDAAEEPGLRRRLVTMASLLQDGKISVEAKVETGSNWLDVLKANYEPGDAIAYFAEQRIGLLQKPFSPLRESNFKATLYILSSLNSQKPNTSRLSQVPAWIGCIGIIIGFGILQAEVVQLPEGWLQSTMLLISIVPEFLLIWVWNSLFG